MGFGKEWDYEYLTIAIDDSGIVNLYWHAPLAVTDTITENANLLPWAEVEATLLKMLSVKYMPLANGEGIVSYKIELTRARLSLQRGNGKEQFYLRTVDSRMELLWQSGLSLCKRRNL